MLRTVAHRAPCECNSVLQASVSMIALRAIGRVGGRGEPAGGARLGARAAPCGPEPAGWAAGQRRRPRRGRAAAANGACRAVAVAASLVSDRWRCLLARRCAFEQVIAYPHIAEVFVYFLGMAYLSIQNSYHKGWVAQVPCPGARLGEGGVAHVLAVIWAPQKLRSSATRARG